ncbi:MAG TPA: ATP-binding protein [Blastocatellia bacterium]|nr:ATP-binding protein [Blastocatellia bacterium]
MDRGKKKLTQEIQDAKERLALLNRHAQHLSPEESLWMQEALEDLRTADEVLRTADEELRQQNEELVRVQREIEAERLRYLDLFEFAPDGYLVTTVDGTILEANRAAANMIGISKEYLIGKPLPIYIDEEHRHEFREMLNWLTRKISPIGNEMETRLHPREGKPLDIGMMVAPIRNAEGKPVMLRWLLRNITERKRAEEEVRKLNAELEQRVKERTVELEQANMLKSEMLRREQQARAEAEAANRSKDELLATVSHELRTPLNAVLGWIHILKSQRGNQEIFAHALEVIERNATLQAQLINDLLEISRIVTGSFRLEKQLTAIAHVIEAELDSIRPMTQTKGVNLTVSLDPTAEFVLGDQARLQQVIGNLLSNALKFTPEGGRIDIKLKREGGEAVITVSDTGEGISPEFLPYVFDRFRQEKTGSTRSAGGLGLGLAIARHIVELHGGKVEARSDGEGKGSKFIVRLPLLNANHTAEIKQASAPEPPLQQDKAPRLDRITVLVIDDEKDARELLSVALEQWGAKVLTAATCAEALARLSDASERPDVLIADIAMPGEDGFDLIHQVRELEPEKGGNIPAIALTAYAGVEDRIRVLNEGYQAHLSKPVSLAELARTVATLAAGEKDEA